MAEEAEKEQERLNKENFEDEPKEEMTQEEKVEDKKEEEKDDLDQADSKAKETKAVTSAEEDEFVVMMKQEEEEKKAEAEARGEEAEPVVEEKEAEEEISLVKKKPKKKKKKEEFQEETFEESTEPRIYALRTTANREDQVMSFVTSNAARKKLEVYSVIRPHGMRGYIFIEAGGRADAEQAAFGVPYARGLLSSIIQYNEIEHMLEQVKKEANIQKNDIAEIISGPFKREKCKITRIDKAKEEVVVELLEAAVPIPLTLKMDAVRVIRRDESGGTVEEEEK